MIRNTVFLLLLSTSISFGQLYQGPANGSVPSGVVVNTNNFSDFSDNSGLFLPKRPLRNTLPVSTIPDYLNKIPPSAPEGSNVVILNTGDVPQNDDPLVLRNFLGFNDPGNYIPPDPYIAVGPQHVMGVDNSRFRIWDKSGNLLKTININQWFATALAGADAFDPKVQYDHFNKRWIMVWLDQNDPPNQRGYFLVSVSDDSIPLGTWYNWAISSSLNGTTETGTWADYQGVGFNNQALFITGRQFTFGGGFNYCKLRIIGKTQLYANTAGPLSWNDLWDIRDPANLGTFPPDGIRPSVIFGTPAESYLVTVPRYNTTCTYLILYKLTNPVGTPSMTGVAVPVTAFNTPVNANQLGGDPLEAGGSAVRNEPIFRNGFLWVTHCVKISNYTYVNYTKINPSTNTAVEDYSVGAPGYFLFYPALGVDQNLNLLLNFTRSGDNEYAGAFYTSHLNTDPPGTFSNVTPLQVGKAHYFKDFGSGRNRWGDYSGSWLDPSDQNNFWTITEYAETPINTWACRVGNIRLIPYQGPRIFTSSDSLFLGIVEVSHSGDTTGLNVYNYGSDTLVINNMQFSTPQYQIIPGLNLPIRIPFRDTINVKFLFRPASSGVITDTLRINTNDPTQSVKKVIFTGKGYVITPSVAGTIYGVTGTQEGGTFITINASNGSGTTIGPTGYGQLTGLSIKPSNGELYGTTSYSNGTELVRINAALGDAYHAAYIPVINVRAIAFDINNDLYFAVIDGRLFKFNLSNNDTDYVGNTGINNLYGLAINPLNGQLWGISVSQGVYRINKTNGSASLVGNSGFNLTADLCFDVYGKLYAVNGIGSQISNLLTIDTSNGTGTLIGSTNKRGINGIAISPLPIGVQNISSGIPEKYELYQNYPNPFNPATKIKFDIPKQSHIKIRIYDITGREAAVIVDEKLNPGSYEVFWNAVNYPSGIYFCRIETSDYTVTKKMVLIK